MSALVYLLLLINGATATDVQKYRPVETVINPGDRIIIRGFEGNVTITGSDGDALVVQGSRSKEGGEFDQWNFKMTKNPGVVEIAVKGGSDMEDWDKVRSGKVPEYSITIKAPSRPLEISWKEGKIQIADWKNEVTINSTKGSISSRNGNGALFAQLVDGNIQIKDHEGALNLQTHKGDVTVSQSKGPVLIDNYSANYQLMEHVGSVQLSNYQGRITLAKVSGQMTFNNINGTIRGTDFKGTVKGDTQKGTVSIKALQVQDFVVNSDTAPVVLDMPKDAGANVSIRSEKGRLHAPPHFIKASRGRWTELRGKLKGNEPGHIKIVSKYGDIVVK